ncbi:MAG: exo-alpha-sialidase [Planctomycetota bacterium]|nr:exo-alpha-sialidase [Planctomycetota bacterium]
MINAGGRVDFVFGDEREFAQCHASTLVQAVDGSLLCAWFGGTKEKNPDVSIWMSTLHGKSWSKPVRAAKVAETAHWNPVLFRDGDDILHLFFKVGVDVIHWKTWWASSRDNGTTWSDAVELVAGDVGGRGPVKNKPIILSDGSWLAPASIEYKEDKRDIWKAFADRSKDHGKTWHRSAYFAKPTPRDGKRDRRFAGAGAIQPTFWESKPGRVHALLRTAAGIVWRCDSKDGGLTWGPYEVTDLLNNNSGLDALRLKDGRVVLIYNPVGRNWGARTPLDIAVSSDNGQTWKTVAHLEDDPDLKSEYSYPTIVRTEDGIAVCYTWNRQRIRCWQIPLSTLNSNLVMSYEEAPELYQQCSPLFHVDANDPPTLIFHGTLDDLVPVTQSDRLAAKLESLGVPCWYDRMDGWPHTMDIAKPVGEHVKIVVGAFFDEYLRGNATERKKGARHQIRE